MQLFRKTTLLQLFRTLFIPIFAGVLLVFAMGSWSLSSPVGSSPDDDHHVTSIWCGSGEVERICDESSNGTQSVPGKLVDTFWCFAFDEDYSAKCQQDLGHLETQGFLAYDHMNSVTQLYPKFFYFVESKFASENANISVISMRIFNSILFVSLLILLLWAAPSRYRPALQWIWPLSLVPLGMFFIPSTNPSSWIIISSVIFLPALLSIPEQKIRHKKIALIILASLAIVIGSGARGDSTIFSVIAVVIALVMTFQRNLRYLKYAFLYLSILSISLIFVNQQTQVKQASGGLAGGASDIDYPRLIIDNFIAMPKLWGGLYGVKGTGNLGWLDTELPWIVPALGITSLLLFIFQVRFFKISSRIALVSLFLLSLAWVVPGYMLVRSNTVVGNFVQTRYIFPILIMLLFVLLLQIPIEKFGPKKIILYIVPVLLASSNSIALYENIQRYTRGADSTSFLLSGTQWWWQEIPISPMYIWVLGTLSFGGAVFAFTTWKVRRNLGDVVAADRLGTAEFVSELFTRGKQEYSVIENDQISRSKRIQSLPMLDVHKKSESLIVDFWNSKTLLKLLVFRDIKTRYKDSSLGIIWSLVKPLALLVVYYFAIGQVLGAQRSIPNFAIFIFTGITAWGFFSEIVSSSTTSVVNNAGLIKKVYLPRIVFPFASLGVSFFTLIVQLVVLLIVIGIFAPLTINSSILLAPIGLLNIAVFGLACGVLLSAVNVYLRDTEHLVEVALMLLFWLSPVVYSFEFVSNASPSYFLTQLYVSNPVTLGILGMQQGLWGNGLSLSTLSEHAFWPANLGFLLCLSLVVNVIFLFFSHRIFNKLQGNFAQQL